MTPKAQVIKTAKVDFRKIKTGVYQRIYDQQSKKATHRLEGNIYKSPM